MPSKGTQSAAEPTFTTREQSEIQLIYVSGGLSTCIHAVIYCAAGACSCLWRPHPRVLLDQDEALLKSISLCPHLNRLSADQQRHFHGELCSAKVGSHFLIFSSVSSHFPKPGVFFTSTSPFAAPTAPPQPSEEALTRHHNARATESHQWSIMWGTRSSPSTLLQLFSSTETFPLQACQRSSIQDH